MLLSSQHNPFYKQEKEKKKTLIRTMAGIIHNIQEKLHMGGDNKEQEKQKAEAHKEVEKHKEAEKYKGEHKEGMGEKIKDKVHGGDEKKGKKDKKKKKDKKEGHHGKDSSSSSDSD